MGRKFKYHFWDKGAALARLEKMLALQPPEPSGEDKRPKIQLNVAVFRDAARRKYAPDKS